ncbi:DUF4123 domain-containing protein [Chitiniphilus shinanonensis]|uniref:DUF4123 domain-containing protein n=1 Tax=Chitiniphilus shinanonensis TaxID=553088 RepID=UPI00302B6DF3
MTVTFDVSPAFTHRETLAGQLLARLRQAGPRAWLLLDPALRPPADGDALAGLLHACPWLAVPLPQVDPALHPLLVEFDLGQPEHLDWLQRSVEEAVTEAKPAQLAQGGGRRIGGWLSGHTTLEILARHLAGVCVQSRPDGRRTLLRWYDPAVLGAVPTLFEAHQQSVLLGPVQHWLYLEGAMQLAQFTHPGRATGQALRLSPAQWRDLDLLGAAHLALLALQQRDALPAPYATARTMALIALRRAQALGFADLQDLSLFATHALSVHPQFDHHPTVQACLARRQPGDYYGGLIADLNESDWQRIAAQSAPLTPLTPSS